MTIKVTYNVTDVYMSQSVSPVYINVSYSDGGTSGGGVWGSITGTLSNQTDLQNALNAKLDESTIDGGTEGQILSKASATDFDFAWINNYAKYLATNVRNQTGSTIAAFQVVYISGATGNKPLISLADADTEATSSKTYGVTATSIANNGTGDVVTAGELSGIDTSAFNEGDLLWLSTTAGGVVTSPPAEPAHAVFIGYVVRSHPTLGVIDVAIANGYELNELHGVQITSAANNDGLFYNSTSTLWENKSITTALGYTPVPTTRNITINGVTYDLSADRTYTISAGISGSGASGQVTYWTGASAVSGSSAFLWDNVNSKLRVNGGVGINRDASGVRALDITGGGIRLTGSTSGSFEVNGSDSTFNINTTGGVVGFNIIDTSNAIISMTGNSYAFRLLANASLFRIRDINAGNIDRFAIHNTGNIGIGFGSTDPAVRFGVSGDTLLRGSGNTSATTALTVQNSDSTNLFYVQNNGYTSNRSRFYIGGPSTTNSIRPAGTLNREGFEFASSCFGTDTTPDFRYVSGQGVATTITSGSKFTFSVETPGFAPTSGTATYNLVNLSTTINQTGGANGITRGLYVNPTLTSAADFRAIETSAGNVLFGSNFFWNNSTNRLGINTSTPTSALQVVGTIRATNIGSPLFFSEGSDDLLLGTQGGTVGFTIKATTRNLMLYSGGLPADGGQRLQVYGDTLLRGSGNTSATTALTVQNSSSTNLFTVRNDGNVGIGTASPSFVLDIAGNTNGLLRQHIKNSSNGTIAQTAILLRNDADMQYMFGITSTGFTTASGLQLGDAFVQHNDILGTYTSSSLVLRTSNANAIKLQTNATTRMTIKSDGKINMSSLPTSSTGLVAGDLWNNAGVINIV